MHCNLEIIGIIGIIGLELLVLDHSLILLFVGPNYAVLSIWATSVILSLINYFLYPLLINLCPIWVACSM